MDIGYLERISKHALMVPIVAIQISVLIRISSFTRNSVVPGSEG